MLPLGCAPWRADGVTGGLDRDQWWVRVHGAVVSTAFARVGPQQPRRRSGLLFASVLLR